MDGHHIDGILNKCTLSGMSNQHNKTYKNNAQSHEYEDTSFKLTFGGTYIYAVLDGHDGAQVAHFARDTLLSEFSGQVMAGCTDISAILGECISNVDRNLHERIMPLVEERADIKIKIAGATNSYEAYQAYPSEIHRLAMIEDQIKGGTTLAVAVIHDNKLHVANVGDSRVILCTYVPGSDTNVEFRIDQLTEDHTTANDNELDRLSQLGLNRQRLQEKRRVGSMETTRSIGDFAVKWGYKDFDILSNAQGPPVISTPYVTHGIAIDKSFYFIFLMSDGVYHAVEEMSDCSLEEQGSSPDPNIRIAHLLHHELKQHNDCQKAADNVLQYICSKHYDSYKLDAYNCARRDDMTLIIRLFNRPSKLYGHKRNHSGTIFRSSFSFCSTSSSDTTPQPEKQTNENLVDMLNNLQSRYSMPPLTLTNKSNPLSIHNTKGSGRQHPDIPQIVSPSQITIDTANEVDQPYIKLGDDFPNDLMMKWMIEDFGLPDNYLEKPKEDEASVPSP